MALLLLVKCQEMHEVCKNWALVIYMSCLQRFDAVGSAEGRASGLKNTEWWDAGIVICLG